MSKQEYRLERWRIFFGSMTARQVSRQDFTSTDDIDTAKSDAMNTTAENNHWYDWQDDMKHPTLSFDCYARQIDFKGVGAIAEFIILYPVYPPQFEGETQTYHCR